MSLSLGMISWNAAQMRRMATSDVRALAVLVETAMPISEIDQDEERGRQADDHDPERRAAGERERPTGGGATSRAGRRGGTGSTGPGSRRRSFPASRVSRGSRLDSMARSVPDSFSPEIMSEAKSRAIRLRTIWTRKTKSTLPWTERIDSSPLADSPGLETVLGELVVARQGVFESLGEDRQRGGSAESLDGHRPGHDVLDLEGGGGLVGQPHLFAVIPDPLGVVRLVDGQPERDEEQANEREKRKAVAEDVLQDLLADDRLEHRSAPSPIPTGLHGQRLGLHVVDVDLDQVLGLELLAGPLHDQPAFLHDARPGRRSPWPGRCRGWT